MTKIKLFDFWIFGLLSLTLWLIIIPNIKLNYLFLVSLGFGALAVFPGVNP